MEILSLLKRSIYHANFNEDFLFQHQLNPNILVFAVMDGCSSGRDSHFVSGMYAKSIYKTCRVLPQMKEILDDFDLETMAPNEIGEYILSQLFQDLKKAKKLFFLQLEEVLATLNLLVLDTKNKTASIHMSGDGIFAVNGKITEIDQNNVPNFLGYHLADSFENVLENDIQSWCFDKVEDIAIATDGLLKLTHKTSKINPLELFLNEKSTKNNKRYFEESYADLIDKKFIAGDDIAIIRCVI